MPTILLKKSDTPGSVPGTANLTNLAGGVEVAVNTADKRVYSMTSASAVIELGTNPSSLTCADVSATVFRSASATITNLIATSASITTLTNNPTFSGGTANGVLYLNGSKVATSGSALTFDGSYFTAASGTGTFLADIVQVSGTATKVNANGVGLEFRGGSTPNITSYSRVGSAYLPMTLDTSASIFSISGTEAMRITSTSLYTASGINVGIGTSSPGFKLDINGVAAVRAANAIRYYRADNAIYTQLYDAGSSGFTLDNTNGNGFRFQSAGTNQAVLDSSGNLGLGVTPSLWRSTEKAIQIGSWMGLFTDSGITTEVSYNNYINSSNQRIYQNTGYALRYQQYNGIHSWHTAPSGTAGNQITGANAFVQTMTLDASGNLGIGTSSPNIGGVNKAITVNSATNTNCSYELSVNNVLQGSLFTGISTSSVALYTVANGPLLFGTNNTERARITSGGLFAFTDTNADKIQFNGTVANSYLISKLAGGGSLADGEFRLTAGNVTAGTFTFSSAGTERARITSGGYFKVQANTSYQNAAGSYNEFANATANEYVCWFRNAHSTNPFGVYIYYPNTSPNGTSSNFLTAIDSTALRAELRSNGGLANYQANNVDLSDARTKKDITPAASMWGKVAALEIVAYKYNDQTHDDVNLGVIAQQVEAVEPVWVDNDGWGDETPEDGVPLKTVYTKDITFAAIKALQEAMARIEQLEADMAALKASA